MDEVLFNDRPRLDVGHGRVLSGHVQDGTLVLSVTADGREVWSADLSDFESAPCDVSGFEVAMDIVAAPWHDRFVVLVGAPCAVALDLADGSDAGRWSTEYTWQSALDVAAVEMSSDGEFLALVSTKRVWVLGRDLAPVLRYEPRFLLAEAPTLDGRRLFVTEYDFDVDDEIVSHYVEF